MSSPSLGGPETVTFDLADLNNRYFRTRRGERIAGLAAFGGMGLVFLAFFASSWGVLLPAVLRLSVLGIAWIFAFIAALTMISLGLSLYIIASPNLASVRLSQDGLVFSFRGGESNEWRWNDPKLRFRLQNFNGQFPPGSNPISTRFLSIPRGPTSALTVAAYDGLLASARSHGLSVESYRGVKGVGLVPIIHDVHGSSVHVLMWFRSPVGK